jgi:acetolactate synthase-1/2/3 large subunit
VGPGQSYANMITGPFIASRAGREPASNSVHPQAAADMF